MVSLSRKKAVFLQLFCLLGSACTASSGSLSHQAIQLQTPPDAPPLPASCRAAKVEGAGRAEWLVFSSRYCASCRRLIDDLASQEAVLSQRGVQATEVFTDEDASCLTSRRFASRHPSVGVRLAEERDRLAWGVVDYPTTFLLCEGRVTSVVRGRPAVAELLALQDCTGAVEPSIASSTEID